MRNDHPARHARESRHHFAHGGAGLLAGLLALCAQVGSARDGDPVSGFGGAGVQTVAFNAGTGANDLALATAIQADGRIVLGGLASGPSGNYDFALARLGGDGALDATFGNGGRLRTDFALGGSEDSVRALALQADGRILAAGRASASLDGNDRWLVGVARYTAGGAADLGFDLDGRRVVDFDPGGAIAVDAVGVAVRGDGRIVVAGTLLPLVNATIALARLTADGGDDTTFNSIGRRLVTLPAPVIAQAMAMRVDGRVLIAGAMLDADLAEVDMFVARFTEAGALDAGFGVGGVRRVAFDQGGDDFDFARAIALDAQGRVILAGEASVAATGPEQRRMAVARLDANGVPDAAFGTGGRVLIPLQRDGIEVGGRAYAVAVDGEGRIVLAGEAGPDDAVGDSDLVVVRLAADGTLDERFGANGQRLVRVDLGPPTNTTEGAAALALDAHGRIVAVGSAYAGTASTLDNDMLVVALTGDTLLEHGFE